MIDLDYKDESNDYILDMFYGIEEEEFYIGIKYKDGSISKYPFTIHNYNIVTSKMERQFKNFYLSFFDKMIENKVIEVIKTSIQILIFLFTNYIECIAIDSMIFDNCFIVINSLLLMQLIKRNYKNFILANRKSNNVLKLSNYLKNKEKFLIEFSKGNNFYGVNIANINDIENDMSFIEYMQNEEIKGQIKLLKYIAEKENSRDGLNG